MKERSEANIKLSMSVANEIHSPISLMDKTSALQIILITFEQQFLVLFLK